MNGHLIMLHMLNREDITFILLPTMVSDLSMTSIDLKSDHGDYFYHFQVTSQSLTFKPPLIDLTLTSDDHRWPQMTSLF